MPQAATDACGYIDRLGKDETNIPLISDCIAQGDGASKTGRLLCFTACALAPLGDATVEVSSHRLL